MLKMENSINKLLKIYKYLVIIYTVVYWIYIVIDDYGFIIKYWDIHWLTYLGIWFWYYAIYFIALTVCFWTPTILMLFIYHKLIKRK